MGQVISFNATKVGRYGDRTQVRSGRDWQLIESAPAVGLAPGPNAEVAVFEPSGEMTEEHINRMVRVTGILEGEADRCGSGHLCWRLNYGAAETTFRTRDDDLVAGTCVTLLGQRRRLTATCSSSHLTHFGRDDISVVQNLVNPAKSTKIAPLRCA